MAHTVMMGPHHFDRSTLGFFATAGLTFVAMVATTAVTTALATTAITTDGLFSLAVVASVVELLAIVTFLAAIGLFLQRVRWGFMLSAWIPGAICSLVGTILAIVTLTSMLHYTRNDKTPADIDDSQVHQLAGAGLAPAVIGLIPQVTFWTMVWPRQEQRSTLPMDEMRPSPNISSKRHSIQLHLASIVHKNSQTAFLAPSDPFSASHSGFSSPTSSLRYSLSNGLRPTTSKTRLILGTPFGSRNAAGMPSSGTTGVRAVRSTDEFENWDTSRVDDNYSTPYGHKTRLETIPGSRPVSPAKPLDGPFADDVDPETLPLPESAVASPGSEAGSIRNHPRPSIASIRRGSTPSIVSPTSPSGDQLHIHPLFRTESPAPPPMASPGTVITASPWGGQAFNADFALQSPRLLGSREGSRPSSPARLMSPVRSRPGSIKSFRTVPAPIDTPVDPLPERNPSQISQLQRPVNRSVTPNG